MKYLLPCFFILLAGCKPSLTDCYYMYYKAPAYIAFKDTTAADVDTLYVNWYAPDSTFTALMSTDTIITPTVYRTGDSLFKTSANNYFFQVSCYMDAELTIPATGSKYRIHYIGGPKTDTAADYKAEGCLPRTFIWRPYISINGVNMGAADTYDLFFLKP